MVLLFVAAFWFIIAALLGAFSASYHGPTSSMPHNDSGRTTVHVLHGVELLFVAPLPFLVFLSLARYVRVFIQSGASHGSGHELAACESQLHRVKTLVVALMTASIATDLLRRAIENVSLSEAAAEGLIMLLLGGYWFALEKVTVRHTPGGNPPAT